MHQRTNDALYGQYTEDDVQKLIEIIQNDNIDTDERYKYAYILNKEHARLQELFGDKLTVFAKRLDEKRREHEKAQEEKCDEEHRKFDEYIRNMKK